MSDKFMSDKSQGDERKAAKLSQETPDQGTGTQTASGTPGNDINFIKEKVKERPINRRKLLRRTVITASMAVIFGLIACFTFLVLEPVFTNWLYPEEEPEPVQLQEEAGNEEMLPEDMILETESEEESQPPVQTTVVERVELGISDYQSLYGELSSLAQEVSKSLVTVIGTTSDTDWLNNPYENEGQASGMIVADNGKQLLILTEKEIVDQSERLTVTFCNDIQADAALMQANQVTGLAVISVERSGLTEDTLGSISTAELGNSGSSLLGTPIIALGRPLGTAGSMAYGMITSVDSELNLTDGNYQLLTTDIYGSTNGSGIIINLSGQVLGIISQENSRSDIPNLITALGISNLKSQIEKMSNGQPMASLGIYGTDVPEDIHEEQGVPQGAYVTGIVMDSPAMIAGIQSGDVIVRMGTEEIDSFADYSRILSSLLPDTEVTLTVMRQGQEEYEEMTVDVLLGTME